MATVEAVKPHPAAERVERWARESGAEHAFTGYVGGIYWAWADEAGVCGACGRSFPVGHLVMRKGYRKAGEAAPWVHVACAGDLRPQWYGGHRDTDERQARRELLRASRGKGSTVQPSLSAAAKALGKLDPRTCPRFRVVPADSTARGKLAELRDAARSFQARASVAATVEHVAPEAKPGKAAKPRKAAKPAGDTVRSGLVLAGVECVACGKAGRRVGGYVGRECPGCGVVNGADGRPMVEAVPVVPVEVAPEVPVVELSTVEAAPVVPVLEVLGGLPACVEDWLSRLVYSVKRDYARAYVLHLLNGADEPADPGTDWARKARWSASRVVAGVR